MEDIPTKQCSKCMQFLPFSAFYKEKKNKDGLQYYCKECDKEHKKVWHKKHIKRKFFHLHTLIRFNGNANSLLLKHEYNNIKSKI